MGNTLARYDVSITDPDATTTRRWVTFNQVVEMLRMLEDGDDMIVHYVGDAEPGVEYS